MTCDAVIFDLFGTLVPSVWPQSYFQSIAETAAAVGADPGAFERAWADPDTVRRRMTGQYATKEQAVEDICRRLGLNPSGDALRRAAEVRFQAVRQWVQPRPDALDTLRRLRSAGLRLGMMSTCSADTPEVWSATPLPGLFDAALFSCTEGLAKPDPRFYALACQRLSVSPGRCLYVGDGADGELTGARQFGFHAVLMCPPEEEPVILARPEGRNWTGPRVGAMSEVLGLLNLH